VTMLKSKLKDICAETTEGRVEVEKKVKKTE